MAHPFLKSALALSGVRMSMWTRWGGVQSLCLPHHVPHQQAPRVGVLVEGMWADEQGLEVGQGVGGRSQQAAKLREGHFSKHRSGQGTKEQRNASSEKRCDMCVPMRAKMALM